MNNKPHQQDTIAQFAFFGTPSVARDTLKFLHKMNIVPKVIITNEATPRGRDMKITKTEVAIFAQENAIATLTPQSLTPESIEDIRKYECDFAIVVAYGKIFPEALIKSFPNGVVNIHYSLLPKYRGAAPVETAIAQGETVTGVSLQYMERELDSGDIIAHTQIPIEQTDTAQELFEKLIPAGATLLLDNLSVISKGIAMTTAQDNSEATFAPKIQKDAGFISQSDDVHTAWNKYRAYSGRNGAYFYAVRDEKRIRVKIRSATYTNNTFSIIRVTPDGKREQSYDELLRAGWNPELF